MTPERDRHGTRPDPPRLARLAGAALIGVFLPLVLVLTLSPGSPIDRLDLDPFCLICGDLGLSNILRNLLLLIPLGVGLGLLTMRGGLVWVVPLLLSALIEGLQLLIPGRNPLLVDLVANGAGGAAGIALARVSLRHLSAPEGSRPPLLFRSELWLGGAVAALAGTAALFSLDPPPPPHYVQWTARLGHLDPYEGRLESASLDGAQLPPGPHPDPGALERALFGGGRLTLQTTAAPPTARTAPILSVYTEERRELFLLGASGRDLVLRLPYRASSLWLARPDVRVAGALEGLTAGEPLAIEYVLRADGACLVMREVAHCGVAPTLADGWAFLLFPGRLSGAQRAALGVVWLLLLGAPAGLLASGTARTLLYACVLAGAAWTVHVPLTTALAPGWNLILLAAGVGMGHATRLVWRAGFPRVSGPTRTDGSGGPRVPGGGTPPDRTGRWQSRDV